MDLDFGYLALECQESFIETEDRSHLCPALVLYGALFELGTERCQKAALVLVEFLHLFSELIIIKRLQFGLRIGLELEDLTSLKLSRVVVLDAELAAQDSQHDLVDDWRCVRHELLFGVDVERLLVASFTHGMEQVEYEPFLRAAGLKLRHDLVQDEGKLVDLAQDFLLGTVGSPLHWLDQELLLSLFRLFLEHLDRVSCVGHKVGARSLANELESTVLLLYLLQP